MANNNEDFKVRHGLKVGDTLSISASTGSITTSGDVAVNGGDLTTTNTTATVFNSNATTVNVGGAATAMSIGNAAGTVTMPGNLTVSGDLTVSGTTTTLDTANLLVEDNTILLNKNEIGPGVTAGSAGIEVERGTGANSANVGWVWNESNNWWNPTGGDATSDQSIFAGGDIIAGTTLGTNGNTLYFNNDNGVGADTKIIVKRNPGDDPEIKWDNTKDTTGRWQTSVDGSTYIDIPNQDLDTDGTPTFARLDVDNIRLDANTIVSTDTNGNITLDPNGTGNIELKTATAGNIWVGAVQTDTPSYGTSSNAAGNLVRGIVRDSTTRTNGDIWSFTSGTGTGARGVSVDNAENTAKAPMLVTRSFSGGAVSGNGVRGRHMIEKARGTPSAPTAVQAADFLGTFEATGYATDRWVSDAQAFVPAFMGFLASENWANSGTTVSNCGAAFQVNLQPAATNLGTNTATPVLQIRPEGATIRANTMVLGRSTGGNAWTATSSSISGTTLTIGTLTAGTIAVGQLVTGVGVAAGTYITANISGSGSGSTWTVSVSQTVASTSLAGLITYITATAGTGNVELNQSPVLTTNTIKNSGGTAVISTSASNTTTTIKGDTLTLENNAGTDYFLANSTLTNVISPTGHINLAGEFTHINTVSTNSAGMVVTPSPEAAASGQFTEATLRTHTNSANDYSSINFNTFRTTDGVNYTPTQNNDYIGQFKFNGNANTSTSAGVPSGPGVTIQAKATETWSNTANGSKVEFNVIKQGTITSYSVITADPVNTIFKADNFEFRDTANNLVTSDKLDYTRTYGEFAYTNAAGFAIAAQNTIYTMPLDTTLNNSNVTISGTGEININTAGWYKIIMSLQITLTVSNQPGQIDFWLRKNSVDVANSKTQVDLLKDQKSVISMDWLVNSDGNDYWEIVYVGTTANYADIDFPTIAATTTPYVSPLAPALLVNVIPAGA